MYILGRFDWDEENKCMKEKFPKLLNIDQPTNYKEYCEAIKIFKVGILS